MTQHDAVSQISFSTGTDSDGVVVNVCQFDQEFYAKVALRMNNPAPANANILPYPIVKATFASPGTWIVRDSGRTDRAGTAVLIRVDGPGSYRIYIKEPTETFNIGANYQVPEHALADGSDSGREIQPLLQIDVTENPDCSLSGRMVHPNGLGRARGSHNDRIPSDGTAGNFTQAHTARSVARALDFGEQLISHQLWADASRTYGTSHPAVQNSRFREAMQIIYGERLVPGTGAGANEQDRVLRAGEIEIEFNHQATNGGRGRLSFRQDNGRPGNRMTSDESLRRTHPATMEFLLQMMQDLGITYARSTGAWRPHTGSTRHRYASAIDLTHLRTTLPDPNGRQHQVTIHFHRTQSTASNPRPTQEHESAERTRMREFSDRVHVYLARARQEGTLGWLGGPWRHTYAQLGLTGPLDPTTRDQQPDAVAIATDNTHVHHVHISVGTDQP